ncbi:hypothetical protein SLEP1_g55726 [Rubroshorea leprosula]|uniref:Retroviral polymerase SH3-like domain-containing protein n=1 Tax=Rubroshorea leprosula TaxID=152421 RepID=A0AAV5MG79_9ROSI|nr:hypothetical protein SLEP1_g55726 [Rubroshorea leprosula]
MTQKKCDFVGISGYSKAYGLYNLITKKIVISLVALFDEDRM